MPAITVDGAHFSYSFNPVHRNNAPNKSQWDISRNDELETFSVSLSRNWNTDGSTWGLHFVNAAPTYLGRDRDHLTPVFIARFVAKAVPQVWHGYPINHVETNERPPEFVLQSWMREQILPKSKISKIIQGKKCRI